MAGKIYLTGDCHADFHKFNTTVFPEQKELDKEDFVIICGDFGGVWNRDTESKQETFELDLQNDRPFTTLFADGNHENFERLGTYPVREWHGGLVHELRPSVLHLMRGQIYDIAGKTVFVFGGARSHDISDGILEPDAPDFKEKYRECEEKDLLFRVNHISWWKEEMASEEEMEEARKNLEKVNYKVDYVITHCASNEVQRLISPGYIVNRMTNFLSEIREKLDYRFWYFGHYHMDMNVTAKDIGLYHAILQAGEYIEKGISGCPKYEKGEKVSFRMAMPEGSVWLTGKIVKVRENGSFMDGTQPCYDIMAEYHGRTCWFKNVAEEDMSAV